MNISGCLAGMAGAAGETSWRLLARRFRRSLVARVSGSLRFLRATLRYVLLWTLAASDNPR